MIDISHKNTTLRYARASGKIFLKPETIKRVKENSVPKGDVASVARSAGILAAKRTPEWMVFSHTLPLDWVDIKMDFLEDGLKFTAEARTVWKTGLEMEVMVAVSGALLNAYDMLKPIQEDITFGEIGLEEKSGGKSDMKDTFDPTLSVALITVSSEKKSGKRPDGSGRVVREFLENKSMRIVYDEILEDEKELLINTVQSLVDKHSVDLVLFNGSCGPEKTDIVPELIRQLSDKLVPGIGEAMRQYGYQRTPFAMHSGQVAGIRNSSLLVSLPGSSRGAEESLNAVFPGLLHLFKMLGR